MPHLSPALPTPREASPSSCEETSHQTLVFCVLPACPEPSSKAPYGIRLGCWRAALHQSPTEHKLVSVLFLFFNPKVTLTWTCVLLCENLADMRCWASLISFPLINLPALYLHVVVQKEEQMCTAPSCTSRAPLPIPVEWNGQISWNKNCACNFYINLQGQQ